MSIAARGKIYPAGQVPKRDVAIVFGAGALPDGTPTNFLESRLLATIELYRTGRTKVIVVSGDNSTSHYDEPSVMRRYLIAHDIPPSKVVADYAGRSTYDTCWRVHFLFGMNDAILVTHGYHLPRALFTCNTLGLKSVGVKADRSRASFSKNYLVREVISDNKAGAELLFRPKPAVGGKFEDSVLRALMQQE
jgi:vancomycin permeability regulator SanA